MCTKITAGDPLGWSEKSPALGLEPLTLGIQGQRLHHSSTEPLSLYFVYFAFVKTSKNESLLCLLCLPRNEKNKSLLGYFALVEMKKKIYLAYFA